MYRVIVRLRWHASVAVVLAGLALVLVVPGASSTARAQSPGDATPGASPTSGVHMRHPLVIVPPVLARTASPGLINPIPRGGYTPAQMQAYLGLSGDGSGQTIGITVAFDTPTIRDDVTRFSAYFGLPLPCDEATGDDRKGAGRDKPRGGDVPPAADCFPFAVAMPGGRPTIDDGWAVETALDVEWAHAIAPKASILLVEAIDVEADSLFGAIDYAAKHGASVISNSWYDTEFEGENVYDRHCRLRRAVCVFASGDEGHPSSYPAASPYAIGVGGTRLTLDAAGAVVSEVAWSGSGGGVSPFERQPVFQKHISTYDMRGTPDVSYNADPHTPFPVFVGSGFYGLIGWLGVGGTSAGTPQWAAIIAVADQLREARGKPPFGPTGNSLQRALYGDRVRRALFDVTEGANGDCEGVCHASVGYDLVTGLGSPRSGIDVALAAR